MYLSWYTCKPGKYQYYLHLKDTKILERLVQVKIWNIKGASVTLPLPKKYLANATF